MKRILLLTLLLVGCRYVFEPPPSEAFLPPNNWRELWATVEKCSGHTGYYERVFWFVADSQMYDTDGKPQEGRWYPGSHNIYLDKRVAMFGGPYSDWYKDRIIMHEMLHDLLGTADHPIEFERCALKNP